MNNNKILRILEYTWLLIGAVGIIAGIYKATQDGWSEALYFLAFTVVAGIMYSLRRRQRKSLEKGNK